MKREFFAHAGLLLESILYAGSYTMAKHVVPDQMSPLELTLVRAIFAGAIFGLVNLLFIREKVVKKDLLALAVCSLFGITISNILFFNGLALTTPVNGALLALTAPLFLVLFAILVRGEIEAGTLVGIAIATSGGALLILSDTGLVQNAPNPVLGNMLVGLSAGAYAIYLTLVKPLLDKYHPVTILSWLFIFATIYLIPFLGTELFAIPWSSFSTTIWLAIAFILLGITFITFLLNTFALRILEPSTVSTYIYTTPLLTALISVFALQNSFSISLVIASVLIMVGGYMVSSSGGPDEEEEDKDTFIVENSGNDSFEAVSTE